MALGTPRVVTTVASGLIVVLGLAAPLLRAQVYTPNLTLTPMLPNVVFVTSQSTTGAEKFSATPGSVTFQVGSATATVTFNGPTMVSGMTQGLLYQLNSPTAYTLSLTQTGFNFSPTSFDSIDARPFDSGTGGCEVFEASNMRLTDTCNVTAFFEISELDTTDGTYGGVLGQPGVRVEIDVQMRAGDTVAVYAVYFQWAVGGTCPASSSATAGPRPHDSSGCAPDGIDHIEIIQAVQAADNSVSLIAGKPTLVRVFVKMSDRIPGMTATLHIKRDNNEVSRSPMMRTFIAPTTFNRSQLGKDDPTGSVDFQLLPDWVEFSGSLDLSVELKLPDPLPGGVTVDPSNFKSTDTLSGNLLLGPSSFKIAYMSFCYTPVVTGTQTCPSDFLFRYDSVLRKTYPIADDNVTYQMMAVPQWARQWPPTITAAIPFNSSFVFMSRLRKIYDTTVGKDWDQLIGFLPPAFNGPVFGLAGRAEITVLGQPRVAMLVEHDYFRQPTPTYNAGTVAHEIGHNMGRHHTNAKSGGYIFTTCGDWDPTTDWIYKTPAIQEYGWDSDVNRLITNKTGDMMSYCANHGQEDWISPFTFDKLLKGNLRPATFLGRGAVPHASAAADQIVISGSARRDGTAGSLDPVYHVPADTDTEPPVAGGSHCLHFSGPQGALGDYCFQLNFVDPELLQPIDEQPFSLKVPFPPGATRIALVAGTTELAALTASSAPPVLTISSPQQGDRWNPGQQTIAWTASDSDGKPLTYALLYSSNGGQSWLPMAIDYTDTQFTFDPAEIDGGQNVLFRVMATSGVSSTSVDVGPLEVVQTPTLSVAQNLVDFGSQLLGEITQQPLTLSNTGSGPLHINSLSIDNPDFKVTAGHAPLVVEAGGSRTISVQWTVAATGAQNATLSLGSNDPANPVTTISLTGGGSNSGTPQISVARTSLDFGSVPSQQQSTLPLTVTNQGNISLNLKTIATDSPFGVSTATPVTLTPGASADITVVFAPLDTGAQSGTLTINSNDPAQPALTVSLSGSSAAPANGQIAVSPETLDFSTLAVGQTKDLKVTVSNTGAADLNVSSMNTGGNANFSAAFTPLKLTAAKSADVTVTFKPRSTGALQGTLTILSDDPWRPRIQMDLTGTGSAATGGAAFNVQPATLSFGTISVGQTSAPQVLTVANSGGAAGHVTALNVSGPYTATPATALPISVAPGGSTTIGVAFKPASAGSQPGSLAIVTDASSALPAVTLTGSGSTSSSVSFTGQWNTDYGSMSLTQTGNSVTGTYPLNNGTITGTVAGNVLTGTWSDSTGSGGIVFTLAADGNSFTGTWTRATGSGNPGGTWNGTRLSGPPSTGVCLPPPANLVSWWSGDGNPNDATGGNNLTVQGGATYAPGEVGQAFQFDGSTGYASAGNPAGLQFTNALTVEAWINPHAAPPSGTMAAILTKWAQIFNVQADSDAYGLWIRNDTAAGLTLFGAIHQAGTNEPHVQGGTIPLNTWTHVAMTFDSGTGTFVAYVNGQAVNTLTSPGAIVTSTRNVFIGREDSILPRPFNGLIDEVSVYGRALTAAEIQGIYNAASAGKCKSTTAPPPATPSIAVSPKSLNFGTVTLGQPAATMKFTISNTGQADLHVKSITQTGDPSFSLVPAFTAVTIAAGKSVDITVQFAPTAAGTPSATLSIASDDPDPTHNPLTVSLAGTINAAPAGGACVPPPANLVSWWSGDGTPNDSTGSNNLTVQGGTIYAPGEVGQAFNFDGSTGYASAGSPASLQFTNALTVEAWINPHAAPASGTMAAILTKWAQIFNPQADSDAYGLWIRNDATAGLTLFGAIHQAGTSEPHVQGGTIPLNAWTHVAMTFDSTTGTFVAYVNGQAVNTLTSPGAIVTSTRNVFIGREDSILPRPFSGLIDEVSIYGRALTAAEIQGIYTAAGAGKCKSAPVAGTLVPTPASLDFGSTATSTPVTRTVTLKNTGTADITIMQAPITPSGTGFTLVTAVPFTVPANGQLDISIKFAPATAGPQSATLTVGTLSIPLTGTGTASSPSTTTLLLSVDSNTFVSSVGLPGGAADNFFVNRLTPPSYPATLRQVQVVFSGAAAALPAGAQIKILSGSNPSGNSNISGISLARTAATVTLGQADNFTVTPITITSGDFVVGFETGYPAGTFPAVLDVSSPLRLRSYFSTDGVTFTLLDASSGVPGNLGIRAVVDVAGN